MMIRFCFDYLSPYSYLAWTQIHALASRHGATVEPVPILLGAVLDAMGTRGPAEVPAKRRYLVYDLTRLAHALGVPLAPPPAHPFNPLFALRVSSLPMPPEKRRALVDRLFAATWAGGPGVADRAVVAGIAQELGIALDDAETDENKARLRRQTDDAIAAGAFGVPTLFAGDQMFWGVDSLPHLERFLGGDNPVTPAILERWAKTPVGIVRKASR